MPVIVRFNLKSRRKPSELVSSSQVQSNGFSLNGQEAGTVLLIHGLTGTPHEMKGIGHLLHRQGYTVRCPRLANHGEPIEVLQRTTWEDCYQSVREAFAHLEATHAPRPMFVAGLSMGALLALLLTDEFPDRIAGVSGFSPTMFYDGWNMPWSRYLLPLVQVTPLKRWLYFKEEPPYGIKNEAIRQRLHRYYDKASLEDLGQVEQFGYPYFPVSLLCQLLELVAHVTKRLSRITMPVQLIQAEEDDMTSVKNSQFIYDRIRSKLKELVLLHDSYHIITVDQERDFVAQKMGDFFRRVSMSSSWERRSAQ